MARAVRTGTPFPRVYHATQEYLNLEEEKGRGMAQFREGGNV